MLYSFLKIIVRLAMPFFCRRIIINKPAMLKMQGPLLLASNHPNSFLDAVIFDILFEKPVWSLARGDVFRKKRIASILGALKMLPVYRFSEGAENLSTNYNTFDKCKKVFRQKGIVLIFSEGKCINEWRLRPLKKGTARLAVSSWEEGIPLKVLPVGINYSSFRRFGKNVFINFGEVISQEHIPTGQSDGICNQEFNSQLQSQLRSLVFDIQKNDTAKKKELLEKKPTPLTNIVLAFPALTGWLTHWPLYWPVKKFTHRKTKHNDHYDSVMVAVLLFVYPLYLFMLSFFLFYLSASYYSFLILLLMPFMAWSYVQLKPQLD